MAEDRFEILIHENYHNQGYEAAFILDREIGGGAPLPVIVINCYIDSNAIGSLSATTLSKAFIETSVEHTLRDTGFGKVAGVDRLESATKCAYKAAYLVRDYHRFSETMVKFDELCGDAERSGVEIDGQEILNALVAYSGDDEMMFNDLSEIYESGRMVEFSELLRGRLEERREIYNDPTKSLTPFKKNSGVRI